MAEVEILVPLGFFAMIAYIAKLIGDTRIRRKALESHANAEVAEAILNRHWAEPRTRSALKWGLVLLSLGIGVLIVNVLGIGFESPVAYAILLLATGTALLGFYVIERDNDEVQADETVAPSSPRETASASSRVQGPEA